MKRITPELKAIAEAHIKARLEEKFDNPQASTKEEVLRLLREGKTFSAVMNQIEMRYASITSILMMRTLSSKNVYVPQAYKNAIYRGFKILFTQN
jgi:hypothetical protein